MKIPIQSLPFFNTQLTEDKHEYFRPSIDTDYIAWI